MSYKKLSNHISDFSVFAIISMFLLFRFWVTPLPELKNGIFALALYGVLIAGLLLGISLVFLGVFAVYRIIWEQINSQKNKYAEV